MKLNQKVYTKTNTVIIGGKADKTSNKVKSVRNTNKNSQRFLNIRRLQKKVPDINFKITHMRNKILSN